LRTTCVDTILAKFPSSAATTGRRPSARITPIVHDTDRQLLCLPLSAAPEDDASAAVSHGGWEILLCRSGGKLFAVENRCSHRNQKLEGGRVRRGYIFCPHHGARFALASGAASGPPATAALRIFACREAADGLVIELTPAVPKN
jgi:3-phenylpropionate/trans-cinnamate dioxygenase ferredoxin subunit